MEFAQGAAASPIAPLQDRCFPWGSMSAPTGLGSRDTPRPVGERPFGKGETPETDAMPLGGPRREVDWPHSVFLREAPFRIGSEGACARSPCFALVRYPGSERPRARKGSKAAVPGGEEGPSRELRARL